MVLQKLYTRRASGRGFTLVELAIVLAVAALLFTGLWRLLSAGNTQLQDQATADQHKQLQAAVQAYLATTQGQTFVLAAGPSANQNLPLPAPFVGACPLAPAINQFCDFLPPGFTTATTNSYGQTYSIQVQSGATPQNYSFMILTNGGAVIPDTSGGRIASLIGNDGGFLYGTNVCGAAFATTACGAFGSWTTSTTAAAPAGFGFAGSASGHIASRTAVSVGALAADPWLARRNIGGGNVGAPASRDFNTLQTDSHMLSNAAALVPGIGSGTAVGAERDFYLGNNTLFGGGDNATVGGQIANLHYLFASTTAAVDPNPAIVATSPCTRAGVADATCTFAVEVQGDQTVSGLLVANRLFAGSFIYSVVSDMRLKHDVKPLAHPLDDLSKIRGVSFNMDQNNEGKLGVTAQEVGKVYPQLVHDIGSGYKGVDYIGLIGPLVGAVNELRARNEALQEQVKLQSLAIKRLEKARR